MTAELLPEVGGGAVALLLFWRLLCGRRRRRAVRRPDVPPAGPASVGPASARPDPAGPVPACHGPIAPPHRPPATWTPPEHVPRYSSGWGTPAERAVPPDTSRPLTFTVVDPAPGPARPTRVRVPEARPSTGPGEEKFVVVARSVSRTALCLLTGRSIDDCTCERHR